MYPRAVHRDKKILCSVVSVISQAGGRFELFFSFFFQWLHMFFSSALWGWVVCLGMHLKYLGWLQMALASFASPQAEEVKIIL